jgi:tetratricopeptide (TPR) repeat protein
MGCGASKPAQEPSSPSKASPTQELGAIRQLVKQGVALQKDGQHAAAEPILRAALERSRALQPSQREALSESLGELATCLVSLKRTAEARLLLTEALALWQPGSADADRRIFVLQLTLAESHRYDKNLDLAVTPFRAALEAASRHEAQRSVALIEAATRLASTLSLLQRKDEAIAVLEHAFQVARRHRTNSRYDKRIALELAGAYQSAGKRDRALELLNGFQAFRRVLRTSDMTFSDLPEPVVLAPDPFPNAAVASSSTAIVSTTPAPSPSATQPATSGTSPPSPSRGNVANAAERVGEMRKDFRACYQRALASDPDLQGTVRLSILVGADGRVTECSGTGFGLPVETIDCLLIRAASTQFDPPEGGKAVIAVPITFIKE